MTTPIPREIIDTLQQHQQGHVLRWWDELDANTQAGLLGQLESIDLGSIENILKKERENHSNRDTPQEKAKRANSPSEVVRLPQTSGDKTEWEKAVQTGEELLASGKVGVILVAGGQGTRLGFQHAKGMFPIGPVSGKTLFQILVEQVIARSRRAGVSIPYYVMTSDVTHQETTEFFSQNNYFGLDPAEVRFFQQGSMPAVDDQTGRLLMEEKGKVASSPDGHGGMLRALSEADLFDNMRDRGIEYLYYHQIDNPTSIVCDPAFLGFHLLRNSGMSTKVVAKRSAEEKMGVACEVDGKTQIIEYSDLPPEVAQKTDEEGQLLLWAGSTAIHVFNRNFLERVIGDKNGLPFHVAHKKVSYIDDSGERVEPDKPNAWKFEKFIFDAMPAAEHALVVETDRFREFNPVKNGEGNDSPQTCRKAMTQIFTGWLQQAGAEVSDGIEVEISPLFALDAEEVCDKIENGTQYDSSIYLAPGEHPGGSTMNSQQVK